MGIGLIPFSPPADFATLNAHDSLRNETAPRLSYVVSQLLAMICSAK